MKKIFSKICLSVLAAVLAVSAAACGGSGWSEKDVTLKDWGAVKENGGFIAATENYVYYINGAGNSAGDNSFGTPVKGALVAAKKSDIKDGKGTVEKCVVVPKLFAATDYNAGVYINGDYVYYATPSTDKTSSGSVASGEIQFMKTKLDGTNSENLLKAGAISDQYRIFEKGGVVYIVVYDSANTRLLSYNTSDKTTVEIAKTDATTNADGYESLDAYLFADADNAADGVVVFTTTVYKEKYDETAANNNSSYSRATESYNRVYAYKAGDAAATLVLDGKDTGDKFALTKISGEYLYYTKTVPATLEGDGTFSYAVKISDLMNKSAGSRTYNTDYVTDTNIVVSPDEIYAYNSENGTVRKVGVSVSTKANEKTVAKIGTSATLSFVESGYLYYLNESSELLRIELDDTSAKYEKISDGAINSSWYAPEVIDIGGAKFAFFADSTAENCGYIKAVSLETKQSVDADGKKTSDAADIDHYVFESSVSLGIFSDADRITAVSEKINTVTSSLKDGKLVFDTDDDGNVVLDKNDNLPVIVKIAETRKAYDALSSDGKKQIEENYATFKNYEKAYEISRTLYKLNDFDKLADKDAKKTDYESAKTALDSLKSDGFDVSTIKALCVENTLWFYQTANTYFTK